jgi:Flp pilus assembly protein TadD
MERPRGVRDRGLDLLRRGWLDEAERLVDEAIEGSPDDGRLWEVRGRIRLRRGDVPGACSALETASLLVPLGPPARVALAECYARTGHRDLAIELYLGLVRDGRCPTELLPSVAAGLGGLGENAAALDVCRELLRRDPSAHEASFGVAFYRRRLGEPPVAVFDDVARAHELDPANTLYRVTLASLLDLLGRREEACDLLRDLDPNAVRCRCCLRRMMGILASSGPRPAGDHAELGHP